MIGYLRGIARDDGILVDSSGVGWKVHCATPLAADSETELLVTCLVKEDSITLYGFAERSQQRCFESLRQVSGVGPGIALAILRDLGVGGLVAALARNDPGPLQAVKGVGARTAQRIVAMAQMPADLQAGDGAAVDDLQQALEAMGFPATEASRALAQARAGTPDGEQAVLAAALAVLRDAR